MLSRSLLGTRVIPALLGLGCVLGAGVAFAAPDAGKTAAADSAKPAVPPLLRLEAAGGVGWVRGASDLSWQALNEARAEVSYLGSPGLVLGVHGLYQSGERSFVLTAPLAGGSGETRLFESERRVAFGTTVGWDPLRCWVAPDQRAGFVLVVMALDVDQFMNRVAPIVGFEPGAGARARVRVAGPVTLSAGGTYQWITNFSSRASDLRVIRARPLGTLRYDAKLAVAFTRFATVDARYVGESINFVYESTLAHSLLLGVSFDA